jgi:hypothetical protein
MAHFAEIGEDNIVIRVLVVPDEEEHRGNNYLSNDLELGGRWIQTSYNGNIRKNYAGSGYIYNEEYDLFSPAKLFPSWVLNVNNGLWDPPIPMPNIPGKLQKWDEENQEWVVVGDDILP